jgi:hypothetical protein
LIEESFVLWGSVTMPSLAKSSFSLNLAHEEGRTVVWKERRGGGRSDCPTGPINDVHEGFYCLFKYSRGFEEDVER